MFELSRQSPSRLPPYSSGLWEFFAFFPLVAFSRWTRPASSHVLDMVTDYEIARTDGTMD